jgi:hypothetical protein
MSVMSNGRSVTKAGCFALMLLCSVANIFARTYTTTFPLVENPISEGSNWISGAAVGIDWADVATTGGAAIGLESGFSANPYDDATALLTGSWGSNQTASATVFTTNRMSGGVYEEVEIRLRSALSPHVCNGYEVLFSLRPDSSCYVQIVRWNGVLGDFTYVAATGGSQYILHPGDTVGASVTNDFITAYINGIQVLQGADTHYSSGSPGIGIFIQGASGVNHDYGYTSYMATDGLPNPPPPSLAINGPNADGSFILSFSGVAGTTYRIEHTGALVPSNWQQIGTATADGSGLVRFTNSPPITVSQQYYRVSWP